MIDPTPISDPDPEPLICQLKVDGAYNKKSIHFFIRTLVAQNVFESSEQRKNNHSLVVPLETKSAQIGEILRLKDK